MIFGPKLFYLVRPRDQATVQARLGIMVDGLVYAGMMLSFLALIRKNDIAHGAHWLYLACMIAWLGDTFAYAFGRLLGRFVPAKLYPSVSPGKTWIGAVGGLCGSFMGCVILSKGWIFPGIWSFPELGWAHGAVITIVGGMLGQSGDLTESLLKRIWGVKDSNVLIPFPGHGGWLDRLDALIFVAPWIYIYATLIWHP